MKQAYSDTETHGPTYLLGMEALDDTIASAVDFLQTMKAKYDRA
jgi:hypothetical protein